MPALLHFSEIHLGTPPQGGDPRIQIQIQNARIEDAIQRPHASLGLVRLYRFGFQPYVI